MHKLYSKLNPNFFLVIYFSFLRRENDNNKMFPRNTQLIKATVTAASIYFSIHNNLFVDL